MPNHRLILSYDGTDFFGWQTQPGKRTVQETVETAFAELVGQKRVRLNASGRTDSGVHAVGQVANAYFQTRIPLPNLPAAINARLPGDVVVRSIEIVPDEFDATSDAIRKMYRYVIHDSPSHDPFMRRFACWSRHRLNAQAMAEAAKPLVGTHDFRSFETHWPNRETSVRTILHLSVNRFGDYIWIDVEADGFLYNMVRAIAGTLINVGRGYWPIEKAEQALHALDRAEAGPTAPPQGLFLMRVTYER